MLEKELFALLDRTGDAAYTVTADGIIRSWNRAAEQLFGYPASEVLGRDIAEVLDAHDALGTDALAGGIDAATRQWERGSPGIQTFDLDVHTRGGERIWVSVSTLVHDDPRTGQRLFARLARDVTWRRRQEELLERTRDLARQLVAVTSAGADHTPTEGLSDQERRILQLFADGRSAAAIARALRISPRTLRNHLHNINRKLRTHSRLEAVTHARHRGLIG